MSLDSSGALALGAGVTYGERLQVEKAHTVRTL